MTTVLVVAAALLCVVLPASAGHLTLVDPPRGTDVDARATDATRINDPARPAEPARTLEVDIKLGANAFRIGGRWFGDKGVHGAWLNGQVGPNGFSLDGRVQGDTGRAYNFKLDADMMDVVTRAAWQWLIR